MRDIDPNLSTGLPSLDRILTGLIPGDNLVWQVESVDDYQPFARSFLTYGIQTGAPVVYFRFAKHPPLVETGPSVEIHHLRPQDGFEAFVSDIHRIIARVGPRGILLFDCLSDLAVDWYSDEMLGNFFMLTCPYILEVGSVAYFSLLRGFHSPESVATVTETAQVINQVLRHGGGTYLHPVKVEGRYSPTMHMLHQREGDDFNPVIESATLSRVMNDLPWSWDERGTRAVGVVDQAFVEAERVLASTPAGVEPIFPDPGILQRLLRSVLTRDARQVTLAERFFTPRDILRVRERMIGTGLVGGKSVGMLLARKVLESSSERWESVLEPHDSFYIGSDVYYTFVVRNGLWWQRERQRERTGFLEGTHEARERMLHGEFPSYILRRFSAMLDHFGQSPILVRSSSLLEDNFGNSFAGKYESVFCANQGPPQKRLEEFLAAVRTVYASTMSERALVYRSQRGLLEQDEQMALLVQRVSGNLYGIRFFPQVAGVGLSYNPYVWSPLIDPRAGVLRLVFGLGTRAVDRSDDDYTRIVALNDPLRRPEAAGSDTRRYSQHRMDVIDLKADGLVSRDFQEVASDTPRLPLGLFASIDPEIQRLREEGHEGYFPWVLTFDRLLGGTSFATDMREMLGTLEKAYEHPVDIEFTANLSGEDAFHINLVQCRPLQVRSRDAKVKVPETQPKDRVLEARGAVIGQSRSESIDRVVWVDQTLYGHLPQRDRYQVARLIGQVLRKAERTPADRVLLIGPGRWGTTTPSLGIPVNFAEVNRVAALCEVVAMRDDLVPDVSLGTHFFNELVENDILYLALFPGVDGNTLDEDFLRGEPNRFLELCPGEENLSDVIRVIELPIHPGDRALRLYADTPAQRVLCHLETPLGSA